MWDMWGRDTLLTALAVHVGQGHSLLAAPGDADLALPALSHSQWELSMDFPRKSMAQHEDGIACA